MSFGSHSAAAFVIAAGEIMRNELSPLITETAIEQQKKSLYAAAQKECEGDVLQQIAMCFVFLEEWLEKEMNRPEQDGRNA